MKPTFKEVKELMNTIIKSNVEEVVIEKPKFKFRIKK